MPIPTSVAVAPDTLHAPEPLKDTGKPDVALAEILIGAVLNARFAMLAKVMV